MRIHVITLPTFIAGEAEAIVRLFEERHIDRLHLRKPGADVAEVERLIREIPARYYPQITIHDFHPLAVRYQLGGIHLTGRAPEAPLHWEGLLSTSCHSIPELTDRRRDPRFDYLTLSPIFDSISKQGYRAAFTDEALIQCREQGVIDQRVLALGGVTFDRIPQVLSMGFGGAMILGDAWKPSSLL